MTDLITPERAHEIRRAALRHAAGMLDVSLTEWAPREYAPNDARTDAEEQLLREEVERLADELRVRYRAGTRGDCSVCGLDFQIKKTGVVREHHGMTAAGFSTGKRCPGANKPPHDAT